MWTPLSPCRGISERQNRTKLANHERWSALEGSQHGGERMAKRAIRTRLGLVIILITFSSVLLNLPRNINHARSISDSNATGKIYGVLLQR